jgi:hypothetical protein
MMKIFTTLTVAILATGLATFPALAADKKDAAKAPASETPAVKKSDSGICHDKSSPSYERTKNFTPFKTMDECIKSGGTVPKNAGAAPTPAAVIKKSDSGICHDPSSSSYEKTTKFTSFASMDECVKSGGKPPKK